MEKVFIITRYETDENHTGEGNVFRARNACSYAMMAGLAPVCPRLFFGAGVDKADYDSADFNKTVETLMASCDSVRQYGASVDGRMGHDLELAEKLGKPVEIFNSIGIPQKDWNSVKFAGNPDYEAACAEAGKIL